MTLRRQLFIIILLTLALPWAGCQYARELEITLRDNQISALTEIAHSASQQLSASMVKLQQGDVAIHATNLPAAAMLDGYADEWHELAPQTFKIPASNDQQNIQKVKLRAGTFHRRLYLFITIPDSTIRYYNPTQSRDNGDRLYLEFWQPDDDSKKLQLTTSAPGAINVKGDKYFSSEIEGSWQQTEKGYNIELTIPLKALTGDIQLTYADDTSPSGPHGGKIAREIAPEIDTELDFDLDMDNYQHQNQHEDATYFVMPKGQVILPNKTLKKSLSVYRQANRKLYAVNAEGWVLAQTELNNIETFNTRGSQKQKADNDQSPSIANTLNGILTQFYRLILSDNTYSRRTPTGPEQGRFTQPFASPLLSGQPSGHWQQARLSEAIITAGFPIFDQADPGKTVGAVIIEQRSEAILSVKNRAISRLFRLSFSAIAVITIALVLFATVISVRLNRLSLAAKQVLSDDGEFSEKIKASSIKDEIGDLNRSLVTLQSRLGEYTQYLKSLASKLSHELRTPLAIVRSSLENLELSETIDEESKVYIQRANDGLDRLRHIVIAMSAATRVEQSIVNAETETIVLNENLKNLVESYEFSAEQHNITISLPENSITITGNNELIAQMLDKLFENALEFTPEGKNIHFSLTENAKVATITVSNDGPLLPDVMQHNLFDSLVSLREKGDEKAHLGLGLHIVKLIAEFHCGQVKAMNRQDATGVEFTINIPCK